MASRQRETTYSRHWKILGFILTSNSGKTLQQIHSALVDMGDRVHERTVRRDLIALQEAGFPIDTEKSDSGTTFYKLAATFRNLPPIPLQPLDVVALLASKSVLADRGNAVLVTQLQDLMNRLRAVCGQDLRRLVEQLEASLYCRPLAAASGGRDGAVPESFVDALARAAHDRHIVRITYRNAQGRESRDREVLPLLLWFHDQQMYMVAHCRQNQDKRVFALARISAVTATRERPDEAIDFNPEEFVRDSFGVFHSHPTDIVLEFDPVLRSYFNMHPIHPTQAIEERDGMPRLNLRVGINEPLVHRLAGFGHRVQVVEPLTLRELVMARHRDALNAYESRADTPSAAQPSLDLVFE